MAHDDRAPRPHPAGLEDAYEILAELRRGEASTSWLAHERDSHRDVVITVVSATAVPRRELLAEIGADQHLLAARRTAGIVPVLSLHWLVDGSLAIVRPRVRGTTLRHLLQATGALSLERTVDILREIGDHLDWARRIGLAHRELGAESVCFQQGGGRMLLAFGPAPILGETTGVPASSRLERDPVLARCSDTATLGRLAWEMLTTRPAPVDGDAGAMSVRRGYREPGLADLRPDLPLSVAADIEGALRCERDATPRGPVAFVAALAAAAAGGVGAAMPAVERAVPIAPPIPDTVPTPVLHRHELRADAAASAAPAAPAAPPKRRHGVAIMAFTVLSAVVLAAMALLMRGGDRDEPTRRVATRAEPTPRVSTGDVEFDRSGVDTGVLVTPRNGATPTASLPAMEGGTTSVPGASQGPTVFAPPGAQPAPPSPRDPCDSEADVDQQRCLRARIAESDAPLNRTYQALTRELSVDPGQLSRLRDAQRAWLARRDAECRSRVDQRGAWAPAFADCIAAQSAARTRELEAELARRRGGI